MSKDQFYLNIFVNDDTGVWVCYEYGSDFENNGMAYAYPITYRIEGSSAIYNVRCSCRVSRSDMIKNVTKYHRRQYKTAWLSD